MEVDHVVLEADIELGARAVHKVSKKGSAGHGTPMRRQLRYWQPFNDWCATQDAG